MGEEALRVDRTPAERGGDLFRICLDSGGEEEFFSVDITVLWIQGILTYEWTEQHPIEESSVLHPVCTGMTENGSVCRIMRYPVAHLYEVESQWKKLQWKFYPPVLCTRLALAVISIAGIILPYLVPISFL